MIDVGTTENKLNSKQKKAAEFLIADSFDMDLTGICEKIGISINTFIQWLETDEFCGYIENLTGKAVIENFPAVWKSLLEQCKKGNVQAIKLYFELKDKYKQDTDTAAKLVNILDDIPKGNKHG